MLKVTIQTSDPNILAWPIYFTERNGVNVGPSGELNLVASFSKEHGTPSVFRIYAPGTWNQVSAEWKNE